jgi:hypothetical protein
VSVVARVLLDHVNVDPAQIHGAQLRVLERVIQRPAGGGLAGQSALGRERGEVSLGAGAIGEVEVPIRVLLAAEQVTQLSLAGEAAPEPGALHLRHVPDQPEQRQRRWPDRTPGKLVAGQALALVQQGRAVVVQPALHRLALPRHRWRVGPGDLRRGPCHRDIVPQRDGARKSFPAGPAPALPPPT